MTETPNHVDLPVLPEDEDEPPLTPAEIEELRRDYTFASAEHASPDEYPRLT